MGPCLQEALPNCRCLLRLHDLSIKSAGPQERPGSGMASAVPSIQPRNRYRVDNQKH